MSPVEATKAHVAAAGVQIEVVTARGRVEVAREKLNAVMGEARDGGLAVQGDLEAVPPVEPLSALTAQLDDSRWHGSRAPRCCARTRPCRSNVRGAFRT